MRVTSVIIAVFLLAATTSAQTETYEEYSYSELIQMIQSEEDSVFELKNAIIRYNPSTDSLFNLYYQGLDDSVFLPFESKQIVINKTVQLEGVLFPYAQREDSLGNLKYKTFSALNNMQWNQPVHFIDCPTIMLYNSTFQSLFRINYNDFELPEPFKQEFSYTRIEMDRNIFQGDVSIRYMANEERGSGLWIRHNRFDIDQHSGTYAANLFTRHVRYLLVSNNTFFTNTGTRFRIEEFSELNFENNDFDQYTQLITTNPKGPERILLQSNSFDGLIKLSMNYIPPSAFIDWDQLEGSLIVNLGFDPYTNMLVMENFADLDANFNEPKFLRNYLDSVRHINPLAYLGEIAFRSQLREFYKDKYDLEKANAVFMDLKDLETKRLAYLYRSDPNFNSYFKWKINQLLKLIAAYGTEPSRVIVFSVYIVIAFGLIYLFFPNHWDSHGRNRLLHRFQFFMKYMNRNDGIHEVYLEDKKQDLTVYEEFRSILEEHRSMVPGIFYRLAVPLYRWSMVSTKTYAWFLSKTDFLKGKWSDVPKNRKWIQTLLVMTAFLIALIYDLIIKILNAIMLSINTFTTLGFGEIPIKGFPRYLAIVQGFVGWFMLTIFSVSLISQLLN